MRDFEDFVFEIGMDSQDSPPNLHIEENYEIEQVPSPPAKRSMASSMAVQKRQVCVIFMFLCQWEVT